LGMDRPFIGQSAMPISSGSLIIVLWFGKIINPKS
jgi:hypothetical protein